MADRTLPGPSPVSRASFAQHVLGGEDGISHLVLFASGDPHDAATQQALAEAQREHPDRIRTFGAAYADFADEFARLEAERRDIDTYNFTRAPVVGLYRNGRLITTFNPRRVFFNEKQQAREVRTQLAIFIRKMVFFDPSQVRDQVNLEVAGKKAEPGAASKAAGEAG